MTPEGKVKRAVNKALSALGADCWRFCPVQSGYGAPALDYLLSIRGRFVAIETKAPGKKLTTMQESTKAAIEAAGGIVLVVWDEGSLAVSMKIILALEFANAPANKTLHVSDCLTIARQGTRRGFEYVAHRHGSEEERAHAQYLSTEQQAPPSDDAAGGDHGAS